MKFYQITIYVMLFVTVLTSGSVYSGTSPKSAARIVGGAEAEKNAHPWIAAIIDSSSDSPYSGFKCGGSLIHPRWAVTAAHCVKKQWAMDSESPLSPQDIDVVLGLHDLKNDSGLRIRVKQIISHPSHRLLKTIHHLHTLIINDSDIALLELAEDAGYPTIPLIPESAALEGKELTALGWGYTDPDAGEISETLQQFSPPLVSNEICQESYTKKIADNMLCAGTGEGGKDVCQGDRSNEICQESYTKKITDNMLCAGTGEGGKDVCQGDSGGPLIIKDGDTDLLAGIVSWGLTDCAQAGHYGVYTRIPRFHDFIYEHVPLPRIRLPKNAAEGDGVIKSGGMVSLNYAPDSDLTVYLTCSNSQEISIPDSVIIPAGSQSAGFDITVTDDDFLDGTQYLTITASIPNEGASVGAMAIDDNETAVLSLIAPSNVAETDGTVSGTLAVSKKPDTDIAVSLHSDIPGKISVPGTVIIPAGETSAVFDMQIISDTVTYGTVAVTLTASVPAWTAGAGTLHVAHQPADFFTESFDGDNDLAYQTLTFILAGSENFYTLCRKQADTFSWDPSGGIPVNFGESNDEEINLSGGKQVSLYGTAYASFFAGRNGYISFETVDTSEPASLSRHFEQPRISAFFADLAPGGTAAWKQSDEGIAVTWQDVPEFSGTGTSSFQIEMLFTGVIRITYLNVSSDTGIAGLSNGEGLADSFAESDLSNSVVCLSGDMNCNGILELKDAVIILKFMAGEEISGLYTGSDVNGDGKIGIEEAVFVLEALGINAEPES